MPRKIATKDEEATETLTSTEIEPESPVVEVAKELIDVEAKDSFDSLAGPATRGKGVLEVMPEGYGFLRANGLSSGPGDIYISQSQIRRFDIRPGDEVEGKVRPPKE